MLQVANFVVDLGTRLSGVLKTLDALCYIRRHLAHIKKYTATTTYGSIQTASPPS